jgi:hypothetical protein
MDDIVSSYKMHDIIKAPIRYELSYLAGIIDGEGCVKFRETKSGHYFRMQVNMTDEPTIDWLQDNFGGRKYFSSRVKYKCKDLWMWELNGDRAIELYKRIAPFLRIKRVYDLE